MSTQVSWKLRWTNYINKKTNLQFTKSHEFTMGFDRKIVFFFFRVLFRWTTSLYCLYVTDIFTLRRLHSKLNWPVDGFHAFHLWRQRRWPCDFVRNLAKTDDVVMVTPWTQNRSLPRVREVGTLRAVRTMWRISIERVSRIFETGFGANASLMSGEKENWGRGLSLYGGGKRERESA